MAFLKLPPMTNTPELPDGFSIGPMRAAEVLLLDDMAAAEGWNPGLADIGIAWDIDPDAFIALRRGDELIGGGTIFSYEGRFGFMGLFIVRPEFRGAGLGIVRDGAWAEQVAVPDVALAAIPEGCSDQEAAALGIPGVTALDCLDLTEVGAGTTVLVLGASGGVSTIAMQLAKTRGARVIAQTGSSERVGQISRYAHEVVVADAATLEEEVRLLAPEGVDVIVDPLAGAFAAPCVRLLAAGGRLVLYGASAGSEFSFAPQERYRKNARVIGYSGLPVAPAATARSQEALFALVAAGTLEVVIADELSLDDANIAISRIRENSVGGKLLLKP